MSLQSDNTPRVRTRFPPSPTGALHLGGARTALFNWLFARHHGGEFVLRLEDTDRQRSQDEHVRGILAAMDWLGLDYDEGPYYQTKRLERYRQAIDQMLEQGRAYWCHCSPEELDKQREAAMAVGGKPMYDGSCRDKNLGPAPGAVVRFKGPRTGSTTFLDLVKGPITFDHKELDDLIILRSDGWPTYHLAVVVDDIDMGITHVIRGDDHVNNTPRQILLYQAMDAELPKFAHVPMILGPDKTKLSKRHGATAVIDFQQMGYLPEAMINALARLGWSHGDQERFTRQELIDYFGLEAVGRSAAVFDTDRLLHLNQQYIQESDPARLAQLLPPFLAARGITDYDQGGAPGLSARADPPGQDPGGAGRLGRALPQGPTGNGPQGGEQVPGPGAGPGAGAGSGPGGGQGGGPTPGNGAGHPGAGRGAGGEAGRGGPAGAGGPHRPHLQPRHLRGDEHPGRRAG